jgi:hypothetical protein
VRAAADAPVEDRAVTEVIAKEVIDRRGKVETDSDAAVGEDTAASRGHRARRLLPRSQM